MLSTCTNICEGQVYNDYSPVRFAEGLVVHVLTCPTLPILVAENTSNYHP